MGRPAYRVRRATVDDLEGLKALWASMQFSAADWEKRLTEFQVAEAADGRLVGALGLEVSGRHGRVYGEAFADFALADTLRQLLWERMQAVAHNQGLARLWTRESAPFWRQNDFQNADAAALNTLPAAWRSEETGWLTLRRWDEQAVEKSLEKELVRFKAEEKRRTEKAMLPGRVLNYTATGLAILLGLVVIVLLIRVLQNQFGGPGR